jgi:hypothetical protein
MPRGQWSVASLLVSILLLGSLLLPVSTVAANPAQAVARPSPGYPCFVVPPETRATQALQTAVLLAPGLLAHGPIVGSAVLVVALVTQQPEQPCELVPNQP